MGVAMLALSDEEAGACEASSPTGSRRGIMVHSEGALAEAPGRRARNHRPAERNEDLLGGIYVPSKGCECEEGRRGFSR